MDDLKADKQESIDNDLNEMLDQQSNMESEWLAKKGVTPIRFNSNVDQFITPDVDGRNGKVIKIDDVANAKKRLIFSALYTAHYLYFYTDTFAISRAKKFNSDIPRFVEYLNAYALNKSKQISIIKDYETKRVAVDQVKPRSAGITGIMLCIKDALDYKVFVQNISDSDYSYLYTLTKTKPAPKSEHSQATMTEWFGRHTWLRSDNKGIGHDLYARLASPKILTSSFKILTVTAFHEIQNSKDELIALFKAEQWQKSDIPVVRESSEFTTYAKYITHRGHVYCHIINRLRASYQNYEGDKERLLKAMMVIVSEITSDIFFGNVMWKIKNNKEIKAQSYDGKNVHSKITDGVTFPTRFLHQLIDYANDLNIVMPVSKAEDTLFCWIMAYQTVPAKDIERLSLNDFKFIRRRNGAVTHIELEYFKSRAHAVHSVRTLGTNKTIGKVVLRFLEEKGKINGAKEQIASPCKLAIGRGSDLTRLLRFICFGIKDELYKIYDEEGISSVFLEALSILIDKGEQFDFKSQITIAEFYERSDFPLAKNLFGFSMIKNSAIHARSDTFNPTQLINYHSHSNVTERESYLSPQNEEWLNNCGRITRTVMQDLTINLFRASQKGKVIFNSEFTKAAEIIDNKRATILAQMKMITGKDNGGIDGFGFAQLSEKHDESDPVDTTYIMDSPHTVMKLKHYIGEVNEKYQLLTRNAPEYLLFTVLPTVEWIEVLFEQRRFQKRSIKRGTEIYHEYKDILPPLFTSQIGGELANP